MVEYRPASWRVRTIALAMALVHVSVVVLIPIAALASGRVSAVGAAGCSCPSSEKLLGRCCCTTVVSQPPPAEEKKPACPKCRTKIAEPVACPVSTDDSVEPSTLTQAPCKCGKPAAPVLEPSPPVDVASAPWAFEWIVAGRTDPVSIRLGSLSHLPSTPPPRI